LVLEFLGTTPLSTKSSPSKNDVAWPGKALTNSHRQKPMKTPLSAAPVID
jgi:hypothetical protein